MTKNDMAFVFGIVLFVLATIFKITHLLWVAGVIIVLCFWCAKR